MKQLGVRTLVRAAVPWLGLLVLPACDSAKPPKPTASQPPRQLLPLDESDAVALRPITSAEVIQTSYPVEPLPPTENEFGMPEATEPLPPVLPNEETLQSVSDSAETIQPDVASPAIEEPPAPQIHEHETSRVDQNPEALSNPLDALPAPPDDLSELPYGAGSPYESTTNIAPENFPSNVQPSQEHHLPPAQRGADPTDQHDLVLSQPTQPTPELIAVARQADTHVAQGVRLAERGAIFSARAEFIQALRLVSDALDLQQATLGHSRSLTRGLRALEEAEDFVPRLAGRTTELRVDDLSAGHRTPVFSQPPAETVTPGTALQRYLTYAQEQLAQAAGDLAPGAAALYSLGKLELLSQSRQGGTGALASARAVVYFQAALLVDPQHAMAANELGVLLARHGRLQDAKAALMHSTQVRPSPAAWRNLAIVCRELGEADLARQAEWQSQQVGATSTALVAQTGPGVQWLDAAAFARTSQTASDLPAAATVVNKTAAGMSKSGRPQQPIASDAPAAGKAPKLWIPWPTQVRKSAGFRRRS